MLLTDLNPEVGPTTQLLQVFFHGLPVFHSCWEDVGFLDVALEMIRRDVLSLRSLPPVERIEVHPGLAVIHFKGCTKVFRFPGKENA